MASKHHAPWIPTAEDRAVADALGPDAAWADLPDGRIGHVVHPRRRGDPRSAVSELIAALSARFPGRAHAVLRRRLRATTPAPFDRDLVAVAARRLAVVVPGPGPLPELVDLRAEPRAASALAEVGGLDPGGPDTDRRWADLARRLAGRVVTDGRPTDDRAIAAVLVAPDGALLGAATNQASAAHLLHAERVLLEACPGPIPPDARLYTTLQCCRACAALVLEVVPRVTVRYEQADPGRFARDTALRRAGRERPLGEDG